MPTIAGCTLTLANGTAVNGQVRHPLGIVIDIGTSHSQSALPGCWRNRMAWPVFLTLWPNHIPLFLHQRIATIGQ